MLNAFIGEEKWKFQKAIQFKKAQYKKERFLKKNVLNMTPEELVNMQKEIKGLSDEFDIYHVDWLSAKVRFVKLAKNLKTNVAASLQQIPQAEASVQPAEETESAADENQAAEKTENTRAAEEIPAPEEHAKATTNVAPEEQPRPAETSGVPGETKNARAAASVVPEETEPTSSAPPAKSSKMKNITLSSASEVKKTKAVEKAALKKRKASTSTESSAPKKLDEEINVDDVASTPLVSSPMPQFIAKEAGIEEMKEDVDIGSTTPVLNDDYWEKLHPNSPLTTPLHPIPQFPVQTEEIKTGSIGRQTSLLSIPEEITAETSEEMENQTAAEEPESSIPQTAAPEIMTQKVVKPSTTNLQPEQQNPHVKRPNLRMTISSLSIISSLISIHMTQQDFDASGSGLQVK
nr:translation initiation factor IF-2-like [Aegilops tauschii subsp. strangulata]